MRKSSYLKTLSGAKLVSVINDFVPEKVNSQPLSEKELLGLYKQYTDPLLTQLRIMTSDNVFVLGNEIRAFWGHLAEYRLEPEKRKNLADAYGHFRRVNIDIFKIICDELDNFLYGYLIDHYHYDYRNVNQSLLPRYMKEYVEAKKTYMDAQLSERTGSNRFYGNIMAKYCQAAKAYACLFDYLQNNCSHLESTKWKTVAKMVWGMLSGVVGIILSLITL